MSCRKNTNSLSPPGTSLRSIPGHRKCFFGSEADPAQLVRIGGPECAVNQVMARLRVCTRAIAKGILEEVPQVSRLEFCVASPAMFARRGHAAMQCWYLMW